MNAGEWMTQGSKAARWGTAMIAAIAVGVCGAGCSGSSDNESRTAGPAGSGTCSAGPTCSQQPSSAEVPSTLAQADALDLAQRTFGTLSIAGPCTVAEYGTVPKVYDDGDGSGYGLALPAMTNAARAEVVRCKTEGANAMVRLYVGSPSSRIDLRPITASSNPAESGALISSYVVGTNFFAVARSTKANLLCVSVARLKAAGLDATVYGPAATSANETLASKAEKVVC